MTLATCNYLLVPNSELKKQLAAVEQRVRELETLMGALLIRLDAPDDQPDPARTVFGPREVDRRREAIDLAQRRRQRDRDDRT